MSVKRQSNNTQFTTGGFVREQSSSVFEQYELMWTQRIFCAAKRTSEGTIHHYKDIKSITALSVPLQESPVPLPEPWILLKVNEHNGILESDVMRSKWLRICHLNCFYWSLSALPMNMVLRNRLWQLEPVATLPFFKLYTYEFVWFSHSLSINREAFSISFCFPSST